MRDTAARFPSALSTLARSIPSRRAVAAGPSFSSLMSFWRIVRSSLSLRPWESSLSSGPQPDHQVVRTRFPRFRHAAPHAKAPGCRATSTCASSVRPAARPLPVLVAASRSSTRLVTGRGAKQCRREGVQTTSFCVPARGRVPLETTALISLWNANLVSGLTTAASMNIDMGSN